MDEALNIQKEMMESTLATLVIKSTPLTSIELQMAVIKAGEGWREGVGAATEVDREENESLILSQPSP
jgi:hypothetical protein